MSFRINNQLTVVTICMIILVWIAAIAMINIEYDNKRDDYFTHRDEVFDNAINSVIRTYESFSNFIFISAIDNDVIKGYLYEANHGDGDMGNRYFILCS